MYDTDYAVSAVYGHVKTEDITNITEVSLGED